MTVPQGPGLTFEAGEGASPPTLVSIVATIGPASESPEMVERLIAAGVSVFRVNFSHGSLEDHARRVSAVRAAAFRLKRTVAMLGDLCGPKIRVGGVPEGGIRLEPGADVVFRRSATIAAVEHGAGGATVVLPTQYPALVDEVTPGHRVLINDGAVRMLAVEQREGELRCVVKTGGLVTTGKGINLPDSTVSAPAITERDWECVQWAVEQGLDFLALSFVRRAEEVLRLKQYLSQLCPVERGHDPKGEGAAIPVVAKIEKPEALRGLERIVDAADAVMVARGDLGVEMDIAQVPIVQKRIVQVCNDYGKPCIVATQMLESMIESPTPTRAEASDVANAVFDGADAVMLSGETAVGKYPAVAVEVMSRIVSAAERRVASTRSQASPPRTLVESKYPTAALAHGAWYVARDVGATIIACWSENGGTARYLSQNQFDVPIVAFSSSERATRRMALLRGVTPVHAAPPESGSLADWNRMVDQLLLHRGWARRGDLVVLLAGRPLGKPKVTNTLAIHRVGDTATGYQQHR
ncbi:MAG: pyruvate kinase [Phycisphaerae bacterium]|nr:pyruvate kinase [Phycisphaerae bacterium]